MYHYIIKTVRKCIITLLKRTNYHKYLKVHHNIKSHTFYILVIT